MSRVPTRYKEEGCSKSALDSENNGNENIFLRQHVGAHSTAEVFDSTKLSTGEGSRDRSPTEGGKSSVANARGGKRKRAALSGSVVNDDVSAPRSVCVGPRQGVRTPSLSGNSPLLFGYPPSRPYGEESLRAREGAGLKVELAVPSPAHDSDGVRGSRAGCPFGWSEQRTRSWWLQ